jgi:ribosomal protein L19
MLNTYQNLKTGSSPEPSDIKTTKVAQSSYTPQFIFSEFSDYISREKTLHKTYPCPSCFNSLYKRKESEVSPYHIAQCYRCGVLVCSECNKIVSGVSHLDKHKDIKSIDQLKIILENQINKTKGLTNFLLVSFINNAKFLTFAKQELTKKDLSDKTKVTLDLFIKRIQSNIYRTEENNSKLEIFLRVNNHRRLEDNLLDYCIKRILPFKWVKKEHSEDRQREAVNHFLIGSQTIWSAFPVQNFAAKLSTGKRKRESDQVNGSIIVVEDDSCEQAIKIRKSTENNAVPREAKMHSKEKILVSLLEQMTKIQKEVKELINNPHD